MRKLIFPQRVSQTGGTTCHKKSLQFPSRYSPFGHSPIRLPPTARRAAADLGPRVTIGLSVRLKDFSPGEESQMPPTSGTRQQGGQSI